MKNSLNLLALILLAVSGGCHQKPAAKLSAPLPVLVVRAVETNVPVLILPAPVGHVMPVSSVTVRPQTGGVIRQIFFKEGQEVRAGDLLFAIDARPAQAALAAAKANVQRDTAQLQNSKIQFDRDEKLFAQKLISQDVFDTSRAAMETLSGTLAADHAVLANAELNLQYTEIHAPIDGRSGGFQVHAGDVVKAPDDVLVTINQLHPIYASFAVAERYLPEIQKQMRGHVLGVTASYENMEGEPPAGELTFVDNAVDEMTGTIQLKATFANADGKLWPGQFVQVALTLSELTNAIVVPSQAVQAGQSGSFIFVVKADQTVEARPVKTGLTHAGQTVIATGLSAGETVVTDGQLRLVPGAKVDVKK